MGIGSAILVNTVVFLLSLLGAFILFKYLKNSATIKTPFVKFGGALAAFLVLFYIQGNFIEKIFVRENKIIINAPSSKKTYVSDLYNFGFSYPAKYQFEDAPISTVDLGTIYLTDKGGNISVVVTSFDRNDVVTMSDDKYLMR